MAADEPLIPSLVRHFTADPCTYISLAAQFRHILRYLVVLPEKKSSETPLDQPAELR
jgi:hypothetical protein